MEDTGRVARRLGHRLLVADVGNPRLQRRVARLQPGKIPLHARTGQGVEDKDVPALSGKTVGKVGADEAGAAGDQDRRRPHATNPRISSSLRASWTRSSASWRATHSASSAKPSPKSCCGA